jgi:eukaryotic-like serine/threonine-protein kinase
MNEILKIGQVVQMESSGATCQVEQFLGSGGQGEVYRANLEGNSVALKWYYPNQASREQWDGLEALIKKGAPNDRFLWPMDVAQAGGVRGFGYVMPLREERYKGLVDLMKRRVEPSFRSLATAGRQLSHSYLQLHSMGFCYRDISFGNVFFDPNNGNVLICDNDNVAIDGKAGGGIKGTPRFMAPEIVRNETLPSRKTDLFSLSVLLFYMFMVHHPLEGKKEASIHALDLAAMNKLYGLEPLFIFDPKDSSNAPVPGYQDNAIVFWPIYPEFLRKYFTQAFTDGLNRPDRRVGESEWRIVMERLADMIVYCRHCGAENFFDPDAPEGQEVGCWLCKKTFQPPIRLVLKKGFVMLNHDTHLYPHHLDENRLHDFTEPAAVMQQHPKDPKKWGLKNLSQGRWVLHLADGSAKDIDPGKTAALIAGATIHFGNSKGEIRR